LQDLFADLSRQDGLESAAFAAAGGNGDALTVRLKSGATPQGTRSGDHVVHVWARAATANGATFRVALIVRDREGGTLRHRHRRFLEAGGRVPHAGEPQRVVAL
jgi:hypothetical protein